MDYMELIRRSLRLAWQYKFLWLFGFFVAVADGYSSISWRKDADDIDWRWMDELGFHIEPALIGLLVVFAIALFFVFWVLAVLAEGSLIFGIFNREQNRSTDFKACWAAGTAKFLRLFGIILISTIAVLTSIMVLVLIVLPAYFMAVPLGVLLTLVAVPLLLGLILTVICVEGWAIRFGVIYDQTWLEAIGNGWDLFRRNVLKSIAVALSSFFTQFALGCGLVVGLLLLAIPFVIVGVIDLWTGLLSGVTVGLVIVLGYTGFIGTFASTIWTLGFMRLTGLAQVADTTGPPAG